MSTLDIVVAQVTTAHAAGALTAYEGLLMVRMAAEDEGAAATAADRDRLESLLLVMMLRAPDQWPSLVRAHLAGDPLPAAAPEAAN